MRPWTDFNLKQVSDLNERYIEYRTTRRAKRKSENARKYSWIFKLYSGNPKAIVFTGNPSPYTLILYLYTCNPVCIFTFQFYSIWVRRIPDLVSFFHYIQCRIIIKEGKKINKQNRLQFLLTANWRCVNLWKHLFVYTIFR